MLAGEGHQRLLGADVLGAARRALDVGAVRFHVPGLAVVVEHDLKNFPDPLARSECFIIGTVASTRASRLRYIQSAEPIRKSPSRASGAAFWK